MNTNNLTWRAAVSAAAVATSATLPLFADYAVTAATSAAQTLALYTSAAATPTYAAAAGALTSPFLITYRDGETVSVTSPNGVTTVLSGTDGTINYTPASGGVWKFENSNGETAYVGVGWNVHNDGFTPTTDAANLTWLETTVEGPDRKVKTKDNVAMAYSDAAFNGAATGTITLTLTSPSNVETVYTKEPGENAKTLRLNQTGIWTVALTTSSGTSTAHITVISAGMMIIIK